MTKKLMMRFVCVVFMMLMPPVWALNLADPGNGFSIEEASTTLNDVYTRLDAGGALDNKLYNSIQKIKTYKDKAESCVKQGREQVKDIDAIINDQYLGNTIKRNASDYQYLNSRRNEIADKAAACSIYAYKAQSLLEHYGDAIKLHVSNNVSQDIEPIWNILGNNIIDQFDVSPEKLYLVSGLKNLTATNIYGIFALLIIALVISQFISSYCKYLLRTLSDERLVSLHVARITKRYIYFVLPPAVLAVLLHIILFVVDPTPVIVLLTYAFLIYFLVIALVNFVLYMPVKYSRDMLKSEAQNLIFKRFLFVVTTILVGYVGALFLRGQALTQDFVDIVRTAYITILVASTFWLCWAGFKLRIFEERKQTFAIFLLKLLLIAGFIALITAEWLGYHQTTVFIIKGLVLRIRFSG